MCQRFCCKPAAVDGHATKIEHSVLRLLRPDHSVETEQEVPVGHNGLAIVSMPLPAASAVGEWSLVWQQDNQRLAQTTIKVQRQPGEVTLQVAPDRKTLDGDGIVNLDIQLSGKNIGYQSGTVKWNSVKSRVAGLVGLRFHLARSVRA